MAPRGVQDDALPGQKERVAPPLPRTWSDKLLGRLVEALPGWMAAPFLSSQRELVLLERRMQRRFLHEYRAQVRGLEPVLRERGAFVGRAVIDAFVGKHVARVKYADAEGNSGGAELQRNVAEVLQTLDPLIAPVLTPFVEGIKSEVNQTLGQAEVQVKRAVYVIAGASLVAGWVLGRATAGGGGGGGGMGGGGGKRR